MSRLTREYDLDGETINWLSEDRAYFLDVKARADEKSGDIKAQLADARREFASGGAPSSVEWFRKAEFAQRAAGAISQQCQQRLSELKDQRREANIAASEEHQTRWERAFVECAKRLLSDDDFVKIRAAADREMQS